MPRRDATFDRSKTKTMTRNDAEIYTGTAKRELLEGPARQVSSNKKSVGTKICKHVTHGGWCAKKHQRCRLLDLTFINQ